MGEMTAFEGAMLAHFPLFLAVDSYGAWGREALVFLAQVTARLAIHKSLPSRRHLSTCFQNLSICLIRANARAILRRV